jgi:hypothetical protein
VGFDPGARQHLVHGAHVELGAAQAVDKQRADALLAHGALPAGGNANKNKSFMKHP